ncbi:hypothetical protein JOC77_000132 [Peribacillus deserti]|uniref:Sin domain-containing protein n=1 Tax=Peribacillus deserti TaxID=673318 RepID=A0ABS2QC76_9BACI|nr:DNA-binding anti-repressor SinI [Peribacillus deserti]MBM7690729.1 hypothetical protein [Peribacillus deserti]
MTLPKEIDQDWVALMLEAKKVGLSLLEVQSFIRGGHPLVLSSEEKENSIQREIVTSAL